MSEIFEYDFREFSSAQAAVMTGVSAELQRNWRRYGFLKQEGGHARYAFEELCEMWLLKTLANFDIGPKVAKSYSADIAKHMMWHALCRIEAYEGRQDTGPCGDHWKVPFSTKLKPNRKLGIGKQPTAMTQWGFRARWMADRIVFGEDQPDAGNPFYLIYQDGYAMPSSEPWFPEMLARDRPDARGAFICVPLHQAALWLLEAIEGPVIKVTWNTEPVEVPSA